MAVKTQESLAQDPSLSTFSQPDYLQLLTAPSQRAHGFLFVTASTQISQQTLVTLLRIFDSCCDIHARTAWIKSRND